MKLQWKLSKDETIWWYKKNEEEKREGLKGEAWARQKRRSLWRVKLKKELAYLSACSCMMKRENNGHRDQGEWWKKQQKVALTCHHGFWCESMMTRRYFFKPSNFLNLNYRRCECTLINVNKNVNVKWMLGVMLVLALTLGVIRI
jgi:hypothetical protein